jgi:N-acetylglutamate synthase-like GNAT family acetyltransferase
VAFIAGDRDDYMPDEFVIRRLRPEDAEGVVACLRRIYGDTYVHPELYDADEIRRQNESLELVSAVAVNRQGQVIGHYALERRGLSPIAETGVAVVLPEYRHHALMERMRTLLEREAVALSLVGLYGHAVTNHTFSQKVDERFHEEPCAISLGWSPQSFHNLSDPAPQRMTELLYFKYLQRPEKTIVYLPAHHAEFLEQIYSVLQLATITERSAPPPGSGAIKVVARRDLGRALIQVEQVGGHSDETIASISQQMLVRGAEAIFLELPLAQPGTPALCEAAEAMGFSFSGIGPAFASDGDVLRLQYVNVPLDLDLILVESEHAKKLLAYVKSERQRVNGV